MQATAIRENLDSKKDFNWWVKQTIISRCKLFIFFSFFTVMGKTCQLVMGPAGSGKSTYCSTMVTHCQSMKRSIHLVNLDPAAEYFEYEPTIDIKNLITLEEVMQQLNYGPNGGLIYCLEYLLENLDWFENELQDYDDDNLIIDCPYGIANF